jgi:hypothetical protein
MGAESERALNLDYASKLWAFANGVTAFAMLQLVGALFAIGTNEMMRAVVASWGGALAVAFGHAVGACVYLALLGWCHRRENQLLRRGELGVCGACTLLLDGAAVSGCLLLAVQADAHHAGSLESLAAPDPGAAQCALQAAFFRYHGVQCIHMSLAAALQENKVWKEGHGDGLHSRCTPAPSNYLNMLM